ncbi:MAG: flippase [Balneolales bacterium]
MTKTLEIIKKAIKGTEGKKYFFNTSWLMGEKVWSMMLVLVVSIFIARYLGPENYGILSYALSLSTLFASITHMGLNGLTIRELVRHPEESGKILGTVFGLKFLGAFIAFAAFLIFAVQSEEVGSIEFWILCIVSWLILLKPFEVIDFWFQAKVESKYSSVARGISTFLISGFKIVLVIIGASFFSIALAYTMQAMLLAGLFIFFYYKRSRISFISWQFKYAKAKELLKQGWMIMLGAFFGMMYMQIDQVMLKWLANSQEVGIYSVAARLSEAWYFIPALLVASLFPKLIELKDRDFHEFKNRLQQLFDLLFIIAFTLAVVITVISKPLISMLYGEAYESAALILSIHIWAGIFIFMRAVFSKWILVEDAIVFSLVTQGLGALSNFLLNLILIPYYEALGAAVATIISYAIASYISLSLNKKTRVIFIMMTKSMISPFRYILKFR